MYDFLGTLDCVLLIFPMASFMTVQVFLRYFLQIKIYSEILKSALVYFKSLCSTNAFHTFY